MALRNSSPQPQIEKENVIGFSRWLLAAWICAALALPVSGFAADIGGYLEDQAKREAEREVAADFDDTLTRARAGDAESQYQLGLAYRNGWATAQDPLAAATWLREAADQGHVRAQHALGSMYESGEGVPASADKARQWYGKAAESGLHEARRSLAALLRRTGEAASN